MIIIGIHKPNEDGDCINCSDPWDVVKYPCQFAEELK